MAIDFDRVIPSTPTSTGEQPAIFHCSLCRSEESQLTPSVICYSCDERADEIRAALKRIPRRYHDWHLARIEGEDSAVTACKEYSQSDTHAWLTLVGAPGNGKTTLAAVTARILLKQKKLDLQWINAGDLDIRLQDCFRMQRSIADALAPYKEADLLVFDDLGSECLTDRFMTYLYTLFNTRWEQCRRTIITSNMKTAQLAEEFGPRIVDRIMRGGQIVELQQGPWSLREQEAGDA